MCSSGLRGRRRLKPVKLDKRELFFASCEAKMRPWAAQGVNRGGTVTPQKSAAAPHFASGHFALSPPPRSMRSPTRCEHPPTTKPVRAVRWVCPEPADDFARSKRWKSSHRGGRIEVDAGRIESFEGAPARNHGPGDRRGVIVDDFRHCGGPNGSNKWHRRGFQPTLPRNRPLPATHASPKSAQRSRGA